MINSKYNRDNYLGIGDENEICNSVSSCPQVLNLLEIVENLQGIFEIITEQGWAVRAFPGNESGKLLGKIVRLNLTGNFY